MRDGQSEVNIWGKYLQGDYERRNEGVANSVLFNLQETTGRAGNILVRPQDLQSKVNGPCLEWQYVGRFTYATTRIASAFAIDSWDVSLILRLFSSIKKDITTKFVIS